MPAPKDGRPPKPKRGPRTLRVLSSKQALAILRLRASIKAAQADRAALAVIFSRVTIPQGGTRPARFTPTQREALTNKLERFERESGSQLVILIVASSQPEDIAAYTEYSGVGIEEMSLDEWLLESDEYAWIDDEVD